MRNFNKVKYVQILISVIFSIQFTNGYSASFSWNRFESRSDSWYQSDEGKQIAENILSFQDNYGTWPKNVDTSSQGVSEVQEDLRGTFDNGATTGEMRFLARAFNATGEVRYLKAFNKALDLILKAQYPSGGWPQRYPPGQGYHRHITFNDGAMVRLMELLKDIASSNGFDFVDASRRESAQKAFDRGIDCILKCQIRVHDKLTVWCAQHDEVDYQPRLARSYELVSLSGGESAGILRFLMSIDQPTPDIIEAIQAGVKWYHDAEIRGIRVEWVDGKLQAVKDLKASSVWARFYEIETNRPFFCDRDGIPKYDYNQIDQERSTGYKWYGDWGKGVFKEYDKWHLHWQHLLVPEETQILAIIGDSTVCSYPENQVRRGWGQFMQEYFHDPVKVYNLAKSGRSTKTFIEQNLWSETLALKPSWILIQFGHNDSHDPDRPESTDAQTDYQDYLQQYIDEARQIGAAPVLVTPMYRRKFDERGRIDDNLLPYANAMKKIAKEDDVPLVDLNSASEKLYLQLGPKGVLSFANASDDQTHFNEKGARAMAELVMQQLPQVEPSLKPYLK